MEKTIQSEVSQSQLLLLLKQEYGLEGHLKELPGYVDLNFLFETSNQQKYIIKIARSEDSEHFIDMQNKAMAHLYNKKLAVPVAIKNKNGGSFYRIERVGRPYYLRVISYLEGDFYADANECNSVTWQALGRFIAEIDAGLADFQHSGAYRFLDWDLAVGVGNCQQKLDYLDNQKHQLISRFLEAYQIEALPYISTLKKGIIHNDGNEHNLLINQTSLPTQITGIIDFGDMVYTQLLNGLAIACAYAIQNQSNPVSVIQNMLSGYHDIRQLTQDEINLLYYQICLRLCTTLCNAAKAIQKTPDNQYLEISVKPAFQSLQCLLKLDPGSFAISLKKYIRLDSEEENSREALLDYRKKHLGKSLSLSYRSPLKITSGKGAYLYDETGRAYLDLVNNVCHVGHCRPEVVAAAHRQMTRLNTNTRYLHDNIISLSKKLLSTMPGELSVCQFVNSGSEANELAIRLARAHTQAKDMIVVDGAYHGNTNACIDISPYKFDGPGGQGAPDWVHKVRMPDPYRGAHLGRTASAGKAYAKDIALMTEKLASEGRALCGFICESIQGVGGQIIMPDQYLSQAYEYVRQANGVCIADEVQVGMGRSGKFWWAFESQAVVPDIVTIGKPLGNGHPVAAVVMTQEIASSFASGMEYFNTFGGNPVSCAIAKSVFDVIESNQLKQHAWKMGEKIIEGLKQLQKQFPIIGDVRGMGLFIGAEFVLDPISKEPASEILAEVVEAMKEKGILLSTEGPLHNVLKIKPPIVIDNEDINYFLSSLEAVLKQY